MSVMINEFEVLPAPEQRRGDPDHKPAEPPAPPAPDEIERLRWMGAERSARLEAD